MDRGAGSYRRYLDGDDTGMAELICDYRDGLLLYLNSYLNDLPLAEDCVRIPLSGRQSENRLSAGRVRSKLGCIQSGGIWRSAQGGRRRVLSV